MGINRAANCHIVSDRWVGQNDHKRVFGMKADQFLTEAGFEVVRIEGKDYPDEILPVVGPADYDMNVLFWGKNSR